jgi:hypothetical protein
MAPGKSVDTDVRRGNEILRGAWFHYARRLELTGLRVDEPKLLVRACLRVTCGTFVTSSSKGAWMVCVLAEFVSHVVLSFLQPKP